MSRHLTLIRHAKASQEHKGGGRDYDRELAPRGEADVQKIAERLAAGGFAPDRILTSAAPRARSTAQAIAEAVGVGAERMEADPDLYLASAARWLESVHSTTDEIDHLALVGHNPGLSDLWGWLTGEPGSDLPTCGVARLALSVGRWSEVAGGSGALLEFDYPKRRL